MWMNLHQLPAGHAMFTLFLSADQPGADACTEEIDVVALRGSMRFELLKATEDERAEYEDDLRVVGISNQSDGYWVWREEGWR